MSGYITTVFAVCIAVGFAATASADYTSVSPAFPGELGHADILSGIYGGDFDPNGMHFTNGAITATRIDDFGLGGILNIVDGMPGDAPDQVFDDGFVRASAAAKYSLLPDQSFGYFPGALGGSYNSLFDVEGYGFAVSGDMPLVDVSGATWRFGHQRDRILGGLVTHSSRMSDNDLDLDWMVTYQVSGLTDGMTTWVMFWEDLVGGGGDFNDMVIEVKATAPVPAPAALALGMIGLGMVSRMRRRQ